MAGLDFYFYALISAVELSRNYFKELIRAGLNSYRNAASDLGPCTAQMLPKRQAKSPRFQIPNSGFHRAFRHLVSANCRKRLVDVICPSALRDEQGRNMFRDDDPCCINCFRAIERTFHGHAFAITSCTAVIDYLNDQYPAVRGSSKASFKRILQRQVQFTKYQPVQLHLRHVNQSSFSMVVNSTSPHRAATCRARLTRNYKAAKNTASMQTG